jgi:hypothetical protein
LEKRFQNVTNKQDGFGMRGNKNAVFFQRETFDQREHARWTWPIMKKGGCQNDNEYLDNNWNLCRTEHSGSDGGKQMDSLYGTKGI